MKENVVSRMNNTIELLRVNRDNLIALMPADMKDRETIIDNALTKGTPLHRVVEAICAVLSLEVDKASFIMQAQQLSSSSTSPDIHNEPCACEGECLAGVSDPSQCVNKLKGEVRVMFCSGCSRLTWHQDCECIPCADQMALMLRQDKEIGQ